DLQYATTTTTAPCLAVPEPVAPDPAALADAAARIAGARRRVILAGGGIATHAAREALTAFAEAIDAPVITTLNGKGGIDPDHPLHLGPVLMHPPLRAVVNEADLLIAVGTRFQAGTGGAKIRIELPPMVHIDVDPRSVGLNFPPVAGVVGDAELALRELLEAGLGPGDAQFRESLRSRAAETRALYRRRIGPDHARVLDSFAKHLGRDAIFVRDSTIPGYNWGNGLLPIDHPRGYLFPTSGAIGPGLPLGLGAAVATRRKTLVMHGDGGLMFHVGELATAAQYGIPVVVVVFNDGGYGVLRGLQARRFDGRFHGTELHTPDFVQLAESMGVPGLHARDAAEFDARLDTAMSLDGPVLIELDAHNLEPIEGVVRAPGRHA
ncbi:MAG: thiamine pyrophosphate-dependent enzyme, partial [Gammaproteobacteria bacterium]|nr:thiamine pyrophosphate-dependent enzyme [Gammaproteobacteria bacterium]